MGYMGRDRLLITGVEWQTRRLDEKYKIVRKFENEPISVTAEWYGAVTNGIGIGISHEHRKPFKMNVGNIITTDGEGAR